MIQCNVCKVHHAKGIFATEGDAKFVAWPIAKIGTFQSRAQAYFNTIHQAWDVFVLFKNH